MQKENHGDNKVNIEKEKVICILRRAPGSEDKWAKNEEKVLSELSEFFEHLGKVIEAVNMVAQKNKNKVQYIFFFI